MSTETTDRVRGVFDDWARRGRAEGMEKGHTPTARPAFDRLELAPGNRYLDIGCGSGYTVRWAVATEGVLATGIDVSAEMIERARAASAALSRCEFRVASFPDAGLPDAGFDAIFSMEVFYYLADLDAGLREVRRILNPGGRFACVVDFYRENPESHGWPEQMQLPLHLWSAAEWRAGCERAGLEVLEQTQLRPALAAGESPTWKHEFGSLMTLARRPHEAR